MNHRVQLCGVLLSIIIIITEKMIYLLLLSLLQTTNNKNKWATWLNDEWIEYKNKQQNKMSIMRINDWYIH